MAWFSYAAIARTPRWTGRGSSSPSLPSRIRKTTRRTTGRRRARCGSSPFTWTGHARTTRRRSAPRQKGAATWSWYRRGPSPLSLARPTAPVVRLSVSKDSPVQKIDGAAIMDRLRFTTTELAPAGLGPKPRSRRGPRARPDEGPRRELIDRHFGVRVRPGETRARRGTQPRSRGDGRRPDPSTRVPPVAPTVRRREKEATAFGHDGNGSDGDEYTRGGDEYEYDDTPGTTVVFEERPGRPREGSKWLPAPVSNPLFETNAGSALDFDAESKDGEKDEIGTPSPDAGGSRGQGRGGPARRPAELQRRAVGVLPRSDVMCALAEVDEMRSRLKRAR